MMVLVKVVGEFSFMVKGRHVHKVQLCQTCMQPDFFLTKIVYVGLASLAQ